MNNPFNFEPVPLKGEANCGCQSHELSRDTAEFESEEEFRGGRRFSTRGVGPRARSFRAPSRTMKKPFRPPPGRPKQPWLRPPYRGRWLSGPVVEDSGLYREPSGTESDPSTGTEHTRWVQDCLNQALGLQLPVTGVMGPETRSAVRSFQRQQGLRVSGIVGPDTEASLKTACAGGRDTGEESELGPVSATLTWLRNQNNSLQPYLFTRTETGNVQEGGIYIAVDTRRGHQILKIGKSRSFKINPYADQRYRNMEQLGHRPGLKFYLATFTIPRGHSGAGVLEMIENAIARLLYRAGLKLPEHGKPFAVQPVRDTVSVRDVLPPPLVYLLGRAYGAKPQRAPGVRVPTRANTLYLTPKTYPKWELTPM